ncbi:MAG TPA: hypothetical protein VHE61_17155, partial [Opitutaceae bacterium]|nr:hypothetical protein [Opitutaceae bacterium]
MSPRSSHFSTLLLAGTTIVFAALWLSERRQNTRLVTEIKAGHGTRVVSSSATASASNPGPSARTASTAPTPAATPAPKSFLATGAIEAALVQLIHDHAWRTDRRGLAHVLDSIAPGDVPFALQLVGRDAVGQGRRELQLMLLRRWAGSDAAAAYAWAGSNAKGRMAMIARQVVADAWAATDPVGALATVGPLPAVLGHLARIEPEVAAENALKVQGGSRNAGIEMVANAWFGKDPQAAIAWVESLPPNNDRAMALRAVMGPMVDADPTAMSGYIANLPANADMAGVARDFAGHWANNDPAAAAAWVSQLPAGSPLQSAAVPLVARQFADDDPAAAGRWVDSLPAGPVHDDAVKAYVFQEMGDDPSIAATWTAKVANPNLRNNLTVDIARNWLRFDPTAARQWIAQTALPDPIKQRL